MIYPENIITSASLPKSIMCFFNQGESKEGNQNKASKTPGSRRVASWVCASSLSYEVGGRGAGWDGGCLSRMSPFPDRIRVSLLLKSQMAATGAPSLFLLLLLSPAGLAWL